MSQSCRVCSHEHRDEIDRRAVTPGANLAELAREFDLGDSSGRGLSRHVAGHLSARLREASERQDRFSAAALVARLGELLDALEAARHSAIDRDDAKALLAAVNAEFRMLESVSARVTADTGVEVSTESLADYQLLRDAVVWVVTRKPTLMLSLRGALARYGHAGARLADDIDTAAKTERARTAL